MTKKREAPEGETDSVEDIGKDWHNALTFYIRPMPDAHIPLGMGISAHTLGRPIWQVVIQTTLIFLDEGSIRQEIVADALTFEAALETVKNLMQGAMR